MRERGSRDTPGGPTAVRQPTLETVAALSGYSRATVSRVVNGAGTVSPKVRQAVLDAVERIGYVPNRAARTLVTRRTDTIGLLVGEPVQFGVADPYLSSVMVAASQSLAGTGIQLVLLMASDNEERGRLGEYVRGGHVDGVILISLHDDDPLPHQLSRARVPLVIGGRTRAAMPGACCVDVDNVQGARAAAGHLLMAGRTRLATVAGPVDMTAPSDRLEGFRAALRDAGHAPPVVAYGRFTRESGEEAAREILRRAPDADGIFAANDFMASGVLRVVRASGRRVPDDVAVIGFDDVELARHTDPPLTTIHQPIAHQGRRMVEELLHRLRGRQVQDLVTFPTHLVVRGSA